MVGQLLILQVEWPGHQGALSRTLGEQIVQTEETLHGNQEESRQEKETLSGQMLVSEIPQSLSREAPLERLFQLQKTPVETGLAPSQARATEHAASPDFLADVRASTEREG